MVSIAAIVAWLQLGQRVFEAGKPLWDDLRALFKTHGIDADDPALDAAIADADARKARAQADATGTPS